MKKEFPVKGNSKCSRDIAVVEYEKDMGNGKGMIGEDDWEMLGGMLPRYRGE